MEYIIATYFVNYPNLYKFPKSNVAIVDELHLTNGIYKLLQLICLSWLRYYFKNLMV